MYTESEIKQGRIQKYGEKGYLSDLRGGHAAAPGFQCPSRCGSLHRARKDADGKRDGPSVQGNREAQSQSVGIRNVPDSGGNRNLHAL